ncbi:MAG: AAA family ATPase, partial [Gordonia sp. (in: high G+C Gram-positive bacteria)]|uniref:AAA family ATPase n=1 Tax=Gordonia sp. (in: high G+C Gram-positive bacteria) TaxID=84139 RepID=UPI003BB6CB30
MSAQVVAGDIGILRVFHDAGVFTAADVHVAQRVADLSGAEISDDELIATALAVRAVRTGSTCVQLRTIRQIGPDASTTDTADVPDTADGETADLPWPDPDDLARLLQSSPLVVGCPSGPLRPLALLTSADGPLLYLRKYFRQEQSIRDILDRRAQVRPVVDATALGAAIDEVFGPRTHEDYDRQRAAAALAATSWTTVLAGGPGTGKTYTVARLLAVMERILGSEVRIGLCAPTGRAASQMQASINDYRAESAALTVAPVATTIHRLLQWHPDGTFGRGAGNRLPYDVVVVDETSMLAVTMMSRLLESLREDTRLILVGDPHQLASVDAGAVLADLVDRDGSAEPGLPPAFDAVADPPAGEFSPDEERLLGGGVITLRRGHRYGGQISAVAEAIKAGDADAVIDLITGAGAAAVDEVQVTLLDTDQVEAVRG